MLMISLTLLAIEMIILHRIRQTEDIGFPDGWMGEFIQIVSTMDEQQFAWYRLIYLTVILCAQLATIFVMMVIIGQLVSVSLGLWAYLHAR